MKTGSAIRLFLLIPGNLLALVLACLGVQCLSTNLLGWFILLFGVAYMAGAAIFLWPRNAAILAGAGNAVQEEAGDRSFWLILPGFVAVFFASPLEYLYLGGETRANIYLQVAGLALILASFVLRIWTRGVLKAQYTGHIQVAAGAQMQTSGPYHYIRHPGYTGFLLMSLGLAVGFGSYLAAAAIFLLLMPGLVYRMLVEEKLLVKQHGDSYTRYAARTKRLFPGLW